MKKYIAISIFILIDFIFLEGLLFASGQLDMLLAPIFHTNVMSWEMVYPFWWYAFIYIGFYLYNGIYIKRLPYESHLRSLISSNISATFLTIFVLYFTQTWNVARLMLLIFTVLVFILFPAIRYLYMLFLSNLKIFQKDLLLIGAGEAAELLVSQLENNPTMGYRIIGVLDDDKTKHGTMLGAHKIIGSISKIRQLNLDNADIIIAIPTLNRHQTLTLLSICQKKADNVKIMPDLTGIPVTSTSIEGFFDGQTILLNIKNNLKNKYNLTIKRIFDIIVSIILLPVILFLLVILSIAIIIESPGNPVFVGKRLGKNGKLFKCYKFRSMFLNGDDMLEDYLNNNPDAKMEWEIYKKLKKFDPRVTRVGKFIRRTSLDELPQIINVLLGNMSLVGPRPYLERELHDMGKSHELILEVIPGITGLWQVSGRNRLSFQQRLALDEYYVRNWSIWLDIYIIIQTFKILIRREGAY